MDASAAKERATFSIAANVKSRLDETVPKSERSRFVEKAIDQALRKAEIEKFRDFLDSIPKTPATTESTTDYLRRKRMEWDGRPIEVLEGRRK